MSTSPSSDRPDEKAAASLLSRLFIELFQTEESALEHPRIEAERLGDVEPGRAMAAVYEHAARALEGLRELSRSEGLESTSMGIRIGDFFSAVRDAVADRALDREKSYRGTLLGMHHGADLVCLVESFARTHNRAALASWCRAWLDERLPLIERATAALSWFAENPARALEGATSPPPDATR